MWRSAAIYARVSKPTDQSVEQQTGRLATWIEGRALDVEVFSDVVSSRKERPNLDRMLTLCRQRRFDAVVVWAFDRFARSARELIMWLDEFRKLGVEFLSYTQALDTSTPMGRASFHIVAAFAELEREMISQRTREKLAMLKARGVRLGRPPIHYDRDLAESLVCRGVSNRAMAKALRVSRATAAKIRARTTANKGGSVLGWVRRRP